MNVSTQIEGTKVLLLELEVLTTVMIISGWGGVVGFLIKARKNEKHQNIIQCLTSVVISCFTGFILSAIAIERSMSIYMVIMIAGVGGVFATPILNLLGLRVKKMLEKFM